jgi:excisionase family DNA binding protein
MSNKSETRENFAKNYTQLLTKNEMASVLQITTRTLEHWMFDGRIPYLRIARTVRFDLEAVMQQLQVNQAR